LGVVIRNSSSLPTLTWGLISTPETSEEEGYRWKERRGKRQSEVMLYLKRKYLIKVYMCRDRPALSN
jgi:hypothetical protein